MSHVAVIRRIALVPMPQVVLNCLSGFVVCCLFVAGCDSPENSEPQAAHASFDDEFRGKDTVSQPVAAEISRAAEPEAAEIVEFKPLQLRAHTGNASGSVAGPAIEPDSEQQITDVSQKLKPLQVLLGRWRGTTRLEYDGMKAVDSHEWIWDLQTDPSQPSLILNSDNSPYLKQARLTWSPQSHVYILTATDGQQVNRRLSGDFTEPVHEVVGSDDKLHRVFRLEFTEDNDEQAAESWQIAFAQQENNRYLLEVSHRRGRAAFRRFDTVSTQRDGTSFAVSDTGYGDKTCRISQGLGTISVSWQGRTYWVCCSGCKAAFEADPQKWIARAEKRNPDK